MGVVSKAAKKRGGPDWGLILIGSFKLLKGIALFVLAVGLLRLLHRDVAATATHWIERLRLDPENRYLHGLLVRIFRVTPLQLKELSAGTFIYAGLFLTEGTGLLTRRTWAEYLTVVSTALFMPPEAYELFTRFTWVRVALLGTNLAIVVYLIYRLKRK
jgi:uncharacterized membrane protein (DUF2068 family)